MFKKFERRRLLAPLAIALITIGAAGSYMIVHASDHDDGSQTTSQNNLNLTDLFAFREDNQTGQAADKGNLILIMNSNGHTPPGQQAFFSTQGRYDFHITRVQAANLDATPTGADDVIIRFEFDEPDANQKQTIKVSAIKGNQTIKGNTSDLTTTTLAEGKAGKESTGKVTLGDSNISVFAGMREDPFFFDVEQFFKVRAGAAGLGPSATFRTPDQAVDGFANQNVNSIVARVPIAFLQTDAAEPIFDVWETTSLKQ